MMKYWHIRLHPTSLQLTPWQADTFFGSLCWALVHRQGEEALHRFLAPFLDHDPPFLLSDGFPCGYLPVPCFFRVRPKRANTPEAYAKIKKMKKVEFLEDKTFFDLCAGKNIPDDLQVPNLKTWHSQLHCQINRVTGTTSAASEEEGSSASLFQLEGWAPAHASIAYSIYFAERHEGAMDTILPLLQDLQKTGFGKKKSSGMGAFHIAGDPQPWNLPLLPDANGFVSLSGFVPATNDPTDGFWQIQTKHGKMGETYAREGNPFKKPWIRLEPGASFMTNGAPHAFYGRMLTHLSDAYPQVVQYAYAFPVPALFTAEDIERLRSCG